MSKSLDKKYIVNSLSIVVQGPLNKKNIIQTAQNISGWRHIFGSCRIVFSISQTDIMVFDGPGIISNPRLIKKYCNNGLFYDALALITECCDVITLSGAAVSMPPVKRGVGNNNCNLQIESAKAGLEHANTEYVLRTRSDILFIDDKFIDFYIKNQALPRHRFAALKQRVLISEFFTLNPYTFETLPFHYSDWFHFGLTEDVRCLWDVPPYDIMDATYYERNPYQKSTGYREKKFLSKYAVEQYLYFTVFKKFFPELTLDYHDDHTSIKESIGILADNFVISDIIEVQTYFKKYEHLGKDEYIHSICIPYIMWKKIINNNEKIDYEFLFSKDIGIAKVVLFDEEEYGKKSKIPNSIILKLFINILLVVVNKRNRIKLQKMPKAFFRDSKFMIIKYIGNLYFK
ncbi:WavE lipopolysaccharide synthesis family protein, partial [Komagataeibacter europaeus]|uniref:WavE lipopolysaccharide synthesis family protein n=1 Tax=Komagataeibacter europaeus TaxID=33995 RepID=UPI0002F7F628